MAEKLLLTRVHTNGGAHCVPVSKITATSHTRRRRESDSAASQSPPPRPPLRPSLLPSGAAAAAAANGGAAIRSARSHPPSSPAAPPPPLFPKTRVLETLLRSASGASNSPGNCSIWSRAYRIHLVPAGTPTDLGVGWLSSATPGRPRPRTPLPSRRSRRVSLPSCSCCCWTRTSSPRGSASRRGCRRPELVLLLRGMVFFVRVQDSGRAQFGRGHAGGGAA